VEVEPPGGEAFRGKRCRWFQVRLTLAGSKPGNEGRPADTLKIAVQPDGLGVGGNAPFRSPEKDAMCVASRSITRGGMEFRSTGLISIRDLRNAIDGPYAHERRK